MEFEYGVRHIRTGDIHRERMTYEEAHEFVYGGEDDEHDFSRVFEVVRRPAGEWQKVYDFDRE